ncbi:MAG: MliC family protein [Pseudomonadota bacterium]
MEPIEYLQNWNHQTSEPNLMPEIFSRFSVIRNISKWKLLLLTVLSVLNFKSHAFASSEQPAGSNQSDPQTTFSRLVGYDCGKGRLMQIRYFDDDDFAVVIVNGKDQAKLSVAQSGSGVRYTDGKLEWHTKGEEGILIHQSNTVVCYEQNNEPTIPLEPKGFVNSRLTPKICAKSRFAPGPSADICSYLRYLKAHDPEKLQTHLEQIARPEETTVEETDGMPTPSQTVLSRTEPQVNADGLYWFTGDGFGEGSPRTLRFAIPESDAVFLSIDCTDESDLVILELFGVVGDISEAQSLPLLFEFDGSNLLFQGEGFIENDEYSGVRLLIEGANPFWLNLQQSNSLIISVETYEALSIDLEGGRPAIKEFIDACGAELNK